MPKLFAALLLLAVPFPAQASAWSTGRFVQWPVTTRSGEIDAPGLRVAVRLMNCGDGRPVGEACGAGDHYMTLTTAAPGAAPARVEGWAGLRWFVGIGALRPGDRRAGVILVTDGGGSGGCVEITVATPVDGGFRTTRIGRPGSYGLCRVEPEKLRWPRDLTGHGRGELVVADDRFDCAFTSCAATWTPPRVLALTDNGGEDVSADPALKPLYRADMARARAACERRTLEPAGACAAYVADAARAGDLPRAWAVVDAQLRRGCRVRSPDDCPSDARLPGGFRADLERLLRRAGYLS